ncbi:MAG TPA: pyridoxine 5'-phosphate synthase [Nitrospirae bacterium]|nr:pyridoxine 5'-phosphate synthase [bacterium BMS3Abin10]GBE38655.1 pyridoxine 5'-phosphate synthase [bacterium BMS3Bbin08]HDH50325.1 pyridoxine 5'-phosphate synthase [Nitrospirota bacterium]HDK16456.1 pyridoxine 5'-phosphate synthase [Nitrospirota bacterium]HDZ83927.1 pyridoxine 5'-phosphate synthase [Nitrospirota bacterium]
MILGVNVDHVATVRQARGGSDPDPLTGAALAMIGGADGITIHLREDRRHIQDRDLKLMRRLVPVELNLEMAAIKEMIGIALKVKPDLVTLVPEKRAELTTEGGLNLKKKKTQIKKAVKAIQDKGIPVSLFINPAITDVNASKEIGASMVEIHTGRYSDTRGRRQALELTKVKKAIKMALDIGLLVNAGHGLNYSNVKKIAAIKGLRGLYIGHSIVSRAVFIGMEKAVKEMKRLIKAGKR